MVKSFCEIFQIFHRITQYTHAHTVVHSVHTTHPILTLTYDDACIAHWIFTLFVVCCDDDDVVIMTKQSES